MSVDEIPLRAAGGEVPGRDPLAGGPVVNGAVETRPPAPGQCLRSYLRDLGHTGVKTGCDTGDCGACTVHVDGGAQRACQTHVGAVAGKKVTTIEGLSPDSSHPLQKAWVALEVPQCGYCQSGQIMKAAELLAKNPKPTRADIVSHMDGNICRCGTYLKIISAIQRAAREG